MSLWIHRGEDINWLAVGKHCWPWPHGRLSSCKESNIKSLLTEHSEVACLISLSSISEPSLRGLFLLIDKDFYYKFNVRICTFNKKYLSMFTDVTQYAGWYGSISDQIFLCPRHIVLPLSVIPSFRHSVILSFRIQFPLIFSNLCHTLRFSNEIWYIGLSREFKGWVWYWGSRIIFSRVMPLRLRKIPLIFSFRSLSPLQIDVLNWNLVYRCVTRIRMLSSNLGPVE